MNEAIFLPTHRGDHIEKTQLEFEPREFCPEVKRHVFFPRRRLCPRCKQEQAVLFSGTGLHGYLCRQCITELLWAIVRAVP